MELRQLPQHIVSEFLHALKKIERGVPEDQVRRRIKHPVPESLFEDVV